jgi:hypothetical protein
VKLDAIALAAILGRHRNPKSRASIGAADATLTAPISGLSDSCLVLPESDSFSRIFW